jgi:hypothetical protein
VAERVLLGFRLGCLDSLNRLEVIRVDSYCMQSLDVNLGSVGMMVLISRLMAKRPLRHPEASILCDVMPNGEGPGCRAGGGIGCQYPGEAVGTWCRIAGNGDKGVIF